MTDRNSAGATRGRRWLRAGAAVLSVAVAVATATGGARAAMHDAETCRKIRSEHEGLNNSGLREIMTKGPDWAKTNLTKERLEQVRRFLSLEEDVRFRCPLGKARPELEAAESEAGATTALQPGEQAPASKALGSPAGAKPTRKPKAASSEPKAQDGAQPVAQGSGAGASGTGGTQNAPAKASAKKKPVVAESERSADTADGEQSTEPARKKPR